MATNELTQIHECEDADVDTRSKRRTKYLLAAVNATSKAGLPENSLQLNSTSVFIRDIKVKKCMGTSGFGAKPAASSFLVSTVVQTPATLMSSSLFESKTPTTSTGLMGQPISVFDIPASTSSGGYAGGCFAAHLSPYVYKLSKLTEKAVPEETKKFSKSHITPLVTDLNLEWHDTPSEGLINTKFKCIFDSLADAATNVDLQIPVPAVDKTEPEVKCVAVPEIKTTKEVESKRMCDVYKRLKSELQHLRQEDSPLKVPKKEMVNISYEERTEKIILYLKELEVENVAWKTLKSLYEHQEFFEVISHEEKSLNFNTITPKLSKEANLLFTHFKTVYVPSLSFNIALKILDVMGASPEVEDHISICFESLNSAVDKSTFLDSLIILNGHLLKMLDSYHSISPYQGKRNNFLEPKKDLNLICLCLLRASKEKAEYLLKEICYVGEACFHYSSFTKELIGKLLPKAIMAIQQCVSTCRITYTQNKLLSVLIKRSALEYLTIYFGYPCEDKTVADYCPIEYIYESCSILDELLKKKINKSEFFDIFIHAEEFKVPDSHHWWTKFKWLLV